jgi:hypothetical protein
VLPCLAQMLSSLLRKAINASVMHTACVRSLINVIAKACSSIPILELIRHSSPTIRSVTTLMEESDYTCTVATKASTKQTLMNLQQHVPDHFKRHALCSPLIHSTQCSLFCLRSGVLPRLLHSHPLVLDQLPALPNSRAWWWPRWTSHYCAQSPAHGLYSRFGEYASIRVFSGWRNDHRAICIPLQQIKAREVGETFHAGKVLFCRKFSAFGSHKYFACQSPQRWHAWLHSCFPHCPNILQGLSMDIFHLHDKTCHKVPANREREGEMFEKVHKYLAVFGSSKMGIPVQNIIF